MIVYNAREGSSSIVGELSRHPDIVVPVFEEFDAHWVSRYFPELNLTQAVDFAYETGLFDRQEVYGRNSFVAYDAERARSRSRMAFSVGFKWRPHDQKRQILAVLQKHDVIVYYLARRDFRELICSLYLTETNSRGAARKKVASKHPQFAIARDTEKSRELRNRLERSQVRAGFWPMLWLMIRRCLRAESHSRFLRHAKELGLETHIIYYEDYLSDSEAFISSICRTIDVAPDAVRSGTILKPIQRVSTRLASERVSGLDRWTLSMAFRLFGSLYARFTSR